jgi:hypothetical protein
MGRRIPLRANSPNGSTVTSVSISINTRGVIRICPGLASSHRRDALRDKRLAAPAHTNRNKQYEHDGTSGVLASHLACRHQFSASREMRRCTQSGRDIMPLTRRKVVQTTSLGAVLASLLKATPAVSAPAAGQGTQIVNLDDRVTFKQQLEHNVGTPFWSRPTRSIISWKASRSSWRSCESSQA